MPCNFAKAAATSLNIASIPRQAESRSIPGCAVLGVTREKIDMKRTRNTDRVTTKEGNEILMRGHASSFLKEKKIVSEWSRYATNRFFQRDPHQPRSSCFGYRRTIICNWRYFCEHCTCTRTFLSVSYRVDRRVPTRWMACFSSCAKV